MEVELGVAAVGLDVGPAAPSHLCLYSCAANQGHTWGMVANLPLRPARGRLAPGVPG